MNEKIFNLINRFSGRQPIFDFIMIFTSRRIRFLYLLVLIFLWFRGPSSRMVVRKAIVSVCIAWFCRITSNILYFRPRPFVSHRVGILIPSKTDSTILSKHTILAFAVSTSILLQQRLLGAILMGVSVLTGFSRVWVGHHYPMDVFRSAIIGGVISYFVEKTYGFRKYF